MPLEAAVTLPNNFVTAWHLLGVDLGFDLPYPKPEGYVPRDAEAPILVWGGATSAGQYVIQILKYYGYQRVTATASRKHHEHLSQLGAHGLVDYNNADVVNKLRKILGNGPIRVIDCVGAGAGSIAPISQIVTEGSSVAILLPVVVRAASETEEPIYSMDVESAASWPGGVVVRGVRAHSYLEVDVSFIFPSPPVANLSISRTSSTSGICNPRSCQIYLDKGSSSQTDTRS